jgi:hypothetical protein
MVRCRCAVWVKDRSRGERYLRVVIIRLRMDGDGIGDKIHRVETNAKLSDQINVGTLRESLDE